MYYSDYPNEPIGRGNPYYRCVYCKRADPEINGDIMKHESFCKYRIDKIFEIQMQIHKEKL